MCKHLYLCIFKYSHHLIQNIYTEQGTEQKPLRGPHKMPKGNKRMLLKALCLHFPFQGLGFPV